MSVTNFDWSTFIAEVADIPPDVVFEIMEDGQLHEIKAHKMVLGMVSITLKTMFYTTEVGDKTAQNIEIKATSKKAFQIIIDDLYKIKSIKDSLQGKSLQEVFDVVNLIERYQMEKLQGAINDLLSNYPITDDTVLDVAAEAIHQSSLFEKEAQVLLIACSKFLKPKLKDAASIFKFAEDNKDQKEVFAALLTLMNGIPPTGCYNCGYAECQDGKPVKEDEFREGLLVTNNPAANSNNRASNVTYWSNCDFGTGTVTKVDATTVTVGHIKEGVTQNGLTGISFNAAAYNGKSWNKTLNGVNLFMFVCQ